MQQGQFTILLVDLLRKASGPLAAGAVLLAGLLAIVWACAYIGLLALRAIVAIVAEAERLYGVMPAIIQFFMLVALVCAALWIAARLAQFMRRQALQALQALGGR